MSESEPNEISLQNPVPSTSSDFHVHRTPSFIKHCCQDMLTAQWTRKLPLIQQTAPAKLAARLIHTFLDDFPDIDMEQYFVIDFCSGAGGKRINYVHAIRALASNAPETGLPATISAIFQN